MAKKVKGMEHLPEKGDRCTVCYDDRLDVSVQKAIELGHDKFTTSLLISLKNLKKKLEIIGEKLTKQTGVEFIFRDYRSEMVDKFKERVKENSLYRQNYCGCLFGLTAQREHKKRLWMRCLILFQIKYFRIN